MELNTLDGVALSVTMQQCGYESVQFKLYDSYMASHHWWP